jgi:hypothetical protein
MSNKTKAVSQSRGSARNFLFSKTDTGRIRDLSKKKAGAINEVLHSFFPELRTGNGFIEHAMQQLDSVAEFAALAIGLDQTQQEEEVYTKTGAFDEHVEVAGILETICQEKSGLWGTLEPGLFGGILPDINGSVGLEIARDLQNRLAEKIKQSVTIGIASYPVITFKKSDMIDNARKALEHAAFFGPGSAVAFVGVSLNISGDKMY